MLAQGYIASTFTTFARCVEPTNWLMKCDPMNQQPPVTSTVAPAASYAGVQASR